MLTTKIQQLRHSNDASISVNKERPIQLFKQMISNRLGNKDIPNSREGLLELARKKNDALNDLLSINLTKKENKAIDFLCEYRFDIEGGYQSFANTINDVKADLLKDYDLIEALSLPEEIIVCYNPDSDTLYDITEMDENFTIKKHLGFPRTPHSLEDDNEELAENGFIEISFEISDMLISFYSISDFVVDTGTDSSGFGLGNLENDIDFVKKRTGLEPVSDNFKDFHYFDFEGNDRPMIILVLSRPNNEDIAIMKQKMLDYK